MKPSGVQTGAAVAVVAVLLIGVILLAVVAGAGFWLIVPVASPPKQIVVKDAPLEVATEIAAGESAVPTEPATASSASLPAESAASTTDSDQPLAKAVGFLMSRQSEDGGFKSQSYGALKNGAATTALVLYAMSHAPDELVAPHRDELQKACDFLQTGIGKKGTVAAPDGTLDYPIYGSALLLLAAERLNLELPDEQRRQLVEFLIASQVDESFDVSPDSIHYGGWDLEAASGVRGEVLKGSNIAVTSLALEALSTSMHKDAPAAVRRARQWVLGAQNEDGGFVFHTWRPHPGNKAMWADEELREKAISYGTTTCDGVRCLSYCGFQPDDEPFTAAIAWLEKHPDVKYVPGLETKAKETGWREGLRYYYYFTQAKALRLLPGAEAPRRADRLQKVLAEQQRGDGGFQNEQPRMFEDDVLIATSFAVIALSEAAH